MATSAESLETLKTAILDAMDGRSDINPLLLRLADFIGCGGGSKNPELIERVIKYLHELVGATKPISAMNLEVLRIGYDDISGVSSDIEDKVESLQTLLALILSEDDTSKYSISHRISYTLRLYEYKVLCVGDSTREDAVTIPLAALTESIKGEMRGGHNVVVLINVEEENMEDILSVVGSLTFAKHPAGRRLVIMLLLDSGESLPVGVLRRTDVVIADTPTDHLIGGYPQFKSVWESEKSRTLSAYQATMEAGQRIFNYTSDRRSFVFYARSEWDVMWGIYQNALPLIESHVVGASAGLGAVAGAVAGAGDGGAVAGAGAK